MQDALYRHGLVGGSGGTPLTEQLEKNYVIADGETIVKGDPVFLDDTGKLNKVKVAEVAFGEIKLITSRYIEGAINGDDGHLSQFCFIPNAFETRFAILETPNGRGTLKICAIRNGELSILYQYDLPNPQQANSQMTNFRMLYNAEAQRLIVVYESWSGGNRAYWTIQSFPLTHSEFSVSTTPIQAFVSNAASNTYTNGLHGLHLFKSGDLILHGNRYDGTTYTNTYVLVNASGVMGTNSNSYGGVNAMVTHYQAVDQSLVNIVGLNWNAIAPRLISQLPTTMLHASFPLVSPTHFIGSIVSATTKRFRNTEDRFVTLFTHNPVGREHRLGILVYSLTGTTFNINTTFHSKERYDYTIYNSWLLSENKIMALVYDGVIAKFKLLFISIDNVTNVATITKEITLQGHGRSYHGADYYNGLFTLSTHEGQQAIFRMYYLTKESIREVSHHGIANANGAAGESIKVVIKGKIKGLASLSKDRDYYLQRNGTLGLDNRGTHVGYAEDDSTLIVETPFYEKKVVTLL